MKVFSLLISILFTSLNNFAQEPDSILVEDWNDNDSYWEKAALSVYSYSNDQLSLHIGKEYEINPDQVIDLKAMMGDSADNIPGIPGIGEKRAKELIKAYGSVEGVIANAVLIGINCNINKARSGNIYLSYLFILF